MGSVSYRGLTDLTLSCLLFISCNARSIWPTLSPKFEPKAIIARCMGDDSAEPGERPRSLSYSLDLHPSVVPSDQCTASLRRHSRFWTRRGWNTFFGDAEVCALAMNLLSDFVLVCPNIN